MNDLIKRYVEIKNKIAHCCQEHGRKAEEITLIAVSKGHEFSAIKELYRAGHRDFGENYAQEFIDKKQLAINEGLEDIVWHFIGSVQSNKIAMIKQADFVHSLCSLKHAVLLNAYAKDISCFLQINLDSDKKRSGISPSDTEKIAGELVKFKYLRFLGLMAIFPQSQKPKVWCEQMVGLKKTVSKALGIDIKLSMGMSSDFEEAIAFGSDFIRIGEKVFGPRF